MLFLSQWQVVAINSYLIQNPTAYLPKWPCSLKGASTCVGAATFELLSVRLLGFDTNTKPLTEHREDSGFLLKDNMVW